MQVVTMDLLYLLTFFSMISFSRAHTSMILKYEDNTGTWNNALETCVDRYNGTLWNVDHVDKDLLQYAMTYLKENEKIWTGMYTVLTSWISDEGCFDADDSSFRRVILGEKNYRVGECMYECDKVSLGYFAVEGRRCLCTDRLPFSKVTSEKCSKPCESCIDASFMRIYKHFSTSTDDNSKNTRCATASCKGKNPVVYRAQNCDKTFPAVCSNGQRINGSKTRSDAEAECAGFDNYLVGAIGDDLCDVFNTSGEGPQYWVGLYKYEVGPYIPGKEVDPDSLYQCQSGVVHDSTLHTNMEKCTVELYSYFCQLDPHDHLFAKVCKDPTLGDMEFIYDDEKAVVNISLSELCARLEKLEPSGQAQNMDLYQSGFIGIIVCAGLIASWCCIVLVICSRKGRKRRKDKSTTPETMEEEMKFITSYKIDKRGSVQVEIHD